MVTLAYLLTQIALFVIPPKGLHDSPAHLAEAQDATGLALQDQVAPLEVALQTHESHGLDISLLSLDRMEAGIVSARVKFLNSSGRLMSFNYGSAGDRTGRRFGAMLVDGAGRRMQLRDHELRPLPGLKAATVGLAANQSIEIRLDFYAPKHDGTGTVTLNVSNTTADGSSSFQVSFKEAEVRNTSVGTANRT